MLPVSTQRRRNISYGARANHRRARQPLRPNLAAQAPQPQVDRGSCAIRDPSLPKVGTRSCAGDRMRSAGAGWRVRRDAPGSPVDDGRNLDSSSTWARTRLEVHFRWLRPAARPSAFIALRVGSVARRGFRTPWNWSIKSRGSQAVRQSTQQPAHEIDSANPRSGLIVTAVDPLNERRQVSAGHQMLEAPDSRRGRVLVARQANPPTPRPKSAVGSKREFAAFTSSALVGRIELSSLEYG